MNKIENRVCIIICKLFEVDKKKLMNNQNEFLTGNIFRLSPIDMVYLLNELEKTFIIKFNKEDLINYKFSTFRLIVEAINKKLGD